MSVRARDAKREQQERSRFVILLHLCTLARGGLSSVAVSDLAHALALSSEEARALVDGLVYHSLVVPVGGGLRVALSPRGAEYLRREAGRRRSVRFPAASAA